MECGTRTNTSIGRSYSGRWSEPILATIALILSPSTLKSARDNADALCARINVQGYEECPNDIHDASVIAEDIRDALLDYQVGCGILTRLL